jgi:hypothetical protein
VWKVLLDFNSYSESIGGISNCRAYSKRRTMTGGQNICAKYTISVGPFYKVNYFVEHHFEPLRHSMTWNLDYTKRSDLFDSVGFWHVQGYGDGCFVYYTQDTLLPNWIPAQLKKTATKIAMKTATSQLAPVCKKAMSRQEGRLGLSKLLGNMKLPEMPQLQLPQFPKLGGQNEN